MSYADLQNRLISPGTQQPELVLPLLQHAWFPRSFIPRGAELQALGRDPDDERPIVRRLVADLLVSYAIPGPAGYRAVPVNQARRWGLDDEALHHIAIENLRGIVATRLRSFAFQTFRAVHIGDELEASTLLLADVWDRLAAEVEGELRVAVAARPMVAFTGMRTWGEDGGRRFAPEQCLAMMAGSARLVKGDFPGATLSDRMLGRDARGWYDVSSLTAAEDALRR